MKSDPSVRGATRLAQQLRRIRNRFGDEAEDEKIRILDHLVANPPRTASAFLRVHDDLMFLRAFPGGRKTLLRVLRTINLLEGWARRLPHKERLRLNDSGVAGSVTRHVFPLPIAQWLMRRAPGEAEIDWRNYDEPALLDPVVFALLRPVEREAAENGDIGTRSLVASARSGDAERDFDWLIAGLGDPAIGPHRADALWQEADAPIAWTLARSRWSTTANVLKRAPAVMRRSMRKPGPDSVARITEPMDVDLLSQAGGRKVIEHGQAALGARCREVVAISFANPDEVYWADLGEGVALAVIGVAPQQRLNLETNTGYVLFSNGAPIGYGGVTPFFRQANTGINIFDAYRGAEAAFLWVEMLRAFHAIYGSTRFVINAYQFGEGNSEAIKSGAFWFYYRLGFRPDSAGQCAIAAREARRLAKRGATPSSTGLLKSLAKGNLIIEAAGFDPADALDEGLLVRASREATRMLAAAPHASRFAAERLVTNEAMSALNVASMDGWSQTERAAFARLAPIALIPAAVRDWPAAEKQGIVAMMRAKGALRERDFAHAAAQCPRFFRALAASLPSAPGAKLDTGFARKGAPE